MDKNNDFIKKVYFSELNLDDHFFDSLRNDYTEFDKWFKKKCNNAASAYVLFDSSGFIHAFLYLKEENGEDSTTNPKLPKAKKLKVGTFKIDAHKTSLSERFITIILRKMIEENFEYTYVTFYPKQEQLKRLFKKYGFSKWGIKKDEEVYYKDLNVKNDAFKDFPRISGERKNNKFLLGIIPKYHTKLFPDSKLSNEKDYSRQDVSFSNTIVKSYLGAMKKMIDIKSNDLIMIYRTNTGNSIGSAYYKSVVTSVCTVVDTCNIYEFETFEKFKEYIGYGTIFNEKELKNLYDYKKYPYVIKMIYNFPLNRRITNGNLKDELGISLDYWGCAHLTDQQFENILKYGDVNENFIIN